MRMILNSWVINKEVFDIAKINCLSVHVYLIKYYWNHNFRGYIRYNLYLGKNKISEDSIVEALTK